MRGGEIRTESCSPGSVEVGVVRTQLYGPIGKYAAVAYWHGDACHQFHPESTGLSTFHTHMGSGSKAGQTYIGGGLALR
jgi:hypothetical protein